MRLRILVHSFDTERSVIMRAEQTASWFTQDAYYTTSRGATYLGDSLELMKRIPDSSVNLVMTSPPFALKRKKEYGNVHAREYVEWFLPFAEQMKRIISEDGSIVIDIGELGQRSAPRSFTISNW